MTNNFVCLLSSVDCINFYQTPETLWELLGTLRSRWAAYFSGNCVPAVKKVRELSSRAFILTLCSGPQVQILERTCLPCPIAIDALATDKNMLASFCGARCILFCWMVNGRQHETREHLRCRGVVGRARYLVWKLVLRFPASVPIHQDGIQGTSVLCYGRPK